jgi:predicted ATPase
MISFCSAADFLSIITYFAITTLSLTSTPVLFYNDTGGKVSQSIRLSTTSQLVVNRHHLVTLQYQNGSQDVIYKIVARSVRSTIAVLTRLKVSGFKNLVDVDVRFGPFTCVAGANGVGKSNLFDAIRFLSALADNTLIDAALSVRSDDERSGDVHSLFHCIGDQYDNEMSFEVEMIVPHSGLDDLGQVAEASITFLRYSLVLAYREGGFGNGFSGGFQTSGLEITKEELTHITQGDARKNLLFKHSAQWRKSVILGERRVPHFISTALDEDRKRVIRQHQDGGSSGRPLSRLAVNLPRTVLSAASAAESPTALMARREMQSWRLLQLEPSALRRPDEFTSPDRLGMSGSFLAHTLYRLAHSSADPDQIYSQVASRLSELIENVRKVWVDPDEKRRLYTLYLTHHDLTTHPARALSDGTLRFLALSVLELDPQEQGLLCLEEPENGIHPKRIPAILKLLEEIATDVSQAVGDYNPLRQVIINTHSPAVVQQVPDDSLLIADVVNDMISGRRFKRASFSYLPDTWRQKAQDDPEDWSNLLSRGNLLAYLTQTKPESQRDRVIDRHDLQPLLFGGNGE